MRANGRNPSRTPRRRDSAAGTAGTLANIGLLFAGKVPVNLNPTLSEVAARACLEQAGIKTILTARRSSGNALNFRGRLAFFISRAKSEHFSCAAVGAPCRGISFADFTACEDDRQHDRSGCGSDSPITSGSSGLPKGVRLPTEISLPTSSRSPRRGLPRRMIACLPRCHSFTASVLQWDFSSRLPHGESSSPHLRHSIAISSRRLRAQMRPRCSWQRQPLRQYLKRVPRDAFGTLRRVVSGAEKLPADLRVAVARFGCEILEGYGLTEASPVVSLSLPHEPRRWRE